MGDAFQVARQLADAFEAAGIRYAVGGAIAYGYWGTFRTTSDVDLNIFAEEAGVDPVADAILREGGRIDREEARRRVADGEHVVAWFGPVRVDLFFNSIPLHLAAAQRVVPKPLLGRPVPMLSAEDTILFKLMFFRGKDLVDIARVIGAQGASLDRAYVRNWLVDLVGEDDRRTVKWDELCQELPAE